MSGTKMHRRDFDLLFPLNHIQMVVRPALCAELSLIVDIARDKIPTLSAILPTVEAVLNYNKDSVLAYDRDGEIVGFYSMLMLSASGLERLLLGELDTSAPDFDAIVKSGEEPAAIYNWAVVAPKLASEGLRHTSVYLRQPIFQRANLYARGTTKAACRIMEHGGYHLVGGLQSDLYRYVRIANRNSRLPVAA